MTHALQILMLVAGLETDLDEMRRVGAVAFWAAFGGVVLPFLGGIATASAFGLPVLWEGRGEVGLIVAGYGLSHQIIGREVFSAAVVMVLVTTMVTPPLLRLTFPKRPASRAVVEDDRRPSGGSGDEINRG